MSIKTYQVWAIASQIPSEKGGEAMNRTRTISIAICVIVTAALITSVYLVAQPKNAPLATDQLPGGKPPQWQISVTGDVAQEKTYTVEEMSQMPLTSVTALVDGKNQTFLGVALIDFCNKTGVNWDAGPLNILGADGANATLSTFQAWNSTYYPYYYNQNVIVLAFAQNGKWLTNSTGGPIRLIVPYVSANYQVKAVSEVKCSPWTVSITGAVENPLIITGENLTFLQSKTVRSDFRPGDEPNRTSNWTGLSMMDVLRAANMSDKAESVTIVAIDGYTKNYTLQQAQDSLMMIGYQENGNPLPLSQGGPFRLFLPTDEYKWGQYWIKFVKEIIVS